MVGHEAKMDPIECYSQDENAKLNKWRIGAWDGLEMDLIIIWILKDFNSYICFLEDGHKQQITIRLILHNTLAFELFRNLQAKLPHYIEHRVPIT